MTMSRRLGISLPLVLMTSVAIGGGFRYYPEAALYTPPDTEANRQFTDALHPGVSIRAWLTQDTFEQVVGFYRAMGKEFKPPSGLPAEKLPSGQVIQKTFVIFDGAPDLVTSRQWRSGSSGRSSARCRTRRGAAVSGRARCYRDRADGKKAGPEAARGKTAVIGTAECRAAHRSSPAHLELRNHLRIRTKLPVEPARGTLTDSCGLDSLTSYVLRGTHLAQVRVAGRAPDGQHGAEPGRAERCRAGPAGDVSVESMRERREPAAALPEFRDFSADLGAGIGALPQH